MPAPERLGKYQILRKLGAGAMGVVYEGFDPLIERSVALKIIRQDDLIGAGAGELRARLRREAQAAGRLAHPGIVAIYEYGEDDSGQAFIVMEMVRGRDLKSVLDSQRFAAQEAVRVMRAVLAALQHAHERGVVHRDIKPSNLFLLDDGGVKVADFGVARMEGSDLTQTGAMIGTPSYMSPEQLLGLSVDGRSDLFSCGVVLYQLLTGEKPFNGSVTTVMHKLLHEEAAPPSSIDNTLIPRWDAVLACALAKRPADRYQSADEFSRAIAIALAEMPREGDTTIVMPHELASSPLARPGTGTLATMAVPKAGPAAPSSDRKVTRATVSRRIPSSLVATAVVASAGSASWWLASDGPSPTSSTTPSAPASAVQHASPAPTSALPTLEPPLTAPQPAAPTAVMPAELGPSALSPRAPTPLVTKAPSPLPVDAWRVRRRSVAAARPSSMGQTMRLLLDVRGVDERKLLTEFDRMLGELPARSAVAVGVHDGHLRWRTQSRAPDVATASRRALENCSEGLTAPCRIVRHDRDFSAETFLEATSALGAVEVTSVRDKALRSVASDLQTWRDQMKAAAALAAVAPLASEAKPAAVPTREAQVLSPALPTPATTAPAAAAQEALAQPPATAPSAPPPLIASLASAPAMAPPLSGAEPAGAVGWTHAQAALSADPGPKSISDALVVLLGARDVTEVEALRRFGSAVSRLPYLSALAMGGTSDGLVYGWAYGGVNEAWTIERAINACERRASSPCTLVSVNGDSRNAQLAFLAGELASYSQEVVRRTFVESARKTLASGKGF